MKSPPTSGRASAGSPSPKCTSSDVIPDGRVMGRDSSTGRRHGITCNAFGDPVDSEGQVIRPESPSDYLGELQVLVTSLAAELIEPDDQAAAAAALTGPRLLMCRCRSWHR